MCISCGAPTCLGLWRTVTPDRTATTTSWRWCATRVSCFMPHDPMRVAHTKRWLALVQEPGLRCTRPLCPAAISSRRPVPPPASLRDSFVKAFLARYAIGFRAFHDLNELGKPYLAADPTLATLRRTFCGHTSGPVGSTKS